MICLFAALATQITVPIFTNIFWMMDCYPAPQMKLNFWAQFFRKVDDAIHWINQKIPKIHTLLRTIPLFIIRTDSHKSCTLFRTDMREIVYPA